MKHCPSARCFSTSFGSRRSFPYRYRTLSVMPKRRFLRCQKGIVCAPPRNRARLLPPFDPEPRDRAVPKPLASPISNLWPLPTGQLSWRTFSSLPKESPLRIDSRNYILAIKRSQRQQITSSASFEFRRSSQTAFNIQTDHFQIAVCDHNVITVASADCSPIPAIVVHHLRAIGCQRHGHFSKRFQRLSHLALLLYFATQQQKPTGACSQKFSAVGSRFTRETIIRFHNIICDPVRKSALQLPASIQNISK